MRNTIHTLAFSLIQFAVLNITLFIGRALNTWGFEHMHETLMAITLIIISISISTVSFIWSGRLLIKSREHPTQRLFLVTGLMAASIGSLLFYIWWETIFAFQIMGNVDWIVVFNRLIKTPYLLLIAIGVEICSLLLAHRLLQLKKSIDFPN